MSDEQKKKEVLHLWWEYLKRSDSYREFCELVRDNITKGINFNKIKWPENLQVNERGKNELNPHIFSNYLYFKDVHSRDFEKWWEVFKFAREDKIESGEFEGVEVYDIERDIDYVIESFKKENGREPTLKEFKYEILHLNMFRIKLFLKVDLIVPCKNQELLKQIGEIVKERRKTPYIRRLRASINLETSSTSQVKENYLRSDELWRYLKIYDYKEQGMKMNDIITEMRKDSTDSDVRSKFYQDLTRARKIIENVEAGIFPGDYQPGD